MKRFYLILIILLTGIFISCDEFLDDMDTAINNSEIGIPYKSGLVLDGNKDSAYEGVNCKISDPEGDDSPSLPGSDIKDVIVVQDDTYLWIYMDTYDTSSHLDETHYIIKINDDSFDGSGYAGSWSYSSSFTSGTSNLAEATGIEVRVKKTELKEELVIKTEIYKDGYIPKDTAQREKPFKL